MIFHNKQIGMSEAQILLEFQDLRQALGEFPRSNSPRLPHVIMAGECRSSNCCSLLLSDRASPWGTITGRFWWWIVYGRMFIADMFWRLDYPCLRNLMYIWKGIKWYQPGLLAWNFGMFYGMSDVIDKVFQNTRVGSCPKHRNMAEPLSNLVFVWTTIFLAISQWTSVLLQTAGRLFLLGIPHRNGKSPSKYLALDAALIMWVFSFQCGFWLLKDISKL